MTRAIKHYSPEVKPITVQEVIALLKWVTDPRIQQMQIKGSSRSNAVL